MVKKNIAILAAGAAIVAMGYYFLFYESEADKVKRVFFKISDAIEKKAGENPIIGAGKTKQIRDLLFDTCIVDVPSRSVSRTMSSQEISSFIFARRNEFDTLALELYDIKVDFQEETTALADFTAVLKGALKTQDPVQEAHELTCTLKKQKINGAFSGLRWSRSSKNKLISWHSDSQHTFLKPSPAGYWADLLRQRSCGMGVYFKKNFCSTVYG